MTDIAVFRFGPTERPFRSTLDAFVVARRWSGMYVVDQESGGGADAAPVVTWVTPTPGSPITRTTAIVVEVEDVALALALVSVRFRGLGLEEVAYRAGRWATSYVGSSVAVVGDVTRWTLRRAGGWPGSPTVQVDVVDVAGQTA